MNREEIKKKLGKDSADLVKNKMIVGLGTGSTVKYFIEFLSQNISKGLLIKAVSSSDSSTQLAKKLKIPLLDIDEVDKIDLLVDGADEVDLQKRMIKGMGGALLREKILYSLSSNNVIIIDESKKVEKLGKSTLAVEIVSFASNSVINNLKKLGFSGKLRLSDDGSKFITDNNNLIFDIKFNKLLDNPEIEDNIIKSVPGVIETGFFLKPPSKVLVGHPDGTIDEI